MPFVRRHIPKFDIINDIQARPNRPKRQKRWLLLSAVLILGFIWFSQNADAQNANTQNSYAQNDYKSEPENAGSLRLRNDAGHVSPAMMMHTEIKAEINGIVATVTYEQIFKNTSNDWVEGIYQFPLAETAGVNHMQMTIGDRIIVGEIKEKQEAKRIYTEAKRQGKRAALTDQQRPNMFTQKVANIGPGETINVELRYVQKVDYKNNRFEWRLPTTFTPRYIPGTPIVADNNLSESIAELTAPNSIDLTSSIDVTSSIDLTSGWAVATDQVPDAHLISPWMTHANGPSSKVDSGNMDSKNMNSKNMNSKNIVNIDKSNLAEKLIGADSSSITSTKNTVSINVELNSGLSLSHIDALYHDIHIQKNQQRHEIKLARSKAVMDRDYVLQWTPASSSVPSAALFGEEIDGDYYSMLMVIPPSTAQTANLARDILFIIDTSGSMQGPSITQARQSLSAAISRLGHTDRFNIIEFNSRHSLLFSSPQTATSSNKNVAIRWVKKLHANGGTEMYSALNATFDQIPESERLKQIVFITDGAVGNERALFSLIHQRLGDSRLFTVGIGSAPNSYFMRKSAEFGRGSFNHINNIHEVQDVMTHLFQKLNSAVSTHISIDWKEKAEQYPERIGELYQNEPLIIAAKTGTPPEHVTIKGELHQQSWHQNIKQQHTKPQSIQNTKQGNSSELAGISSIWARAKIAHLEDSHTTGELDKTQVKNRILAVALAHKLISRFTSFVAVEQEPVRPSTTRLKTKAIPNQVARGQNAQQVVLPQTATTGEIAWWLGLFSFITFVFVYCMRRE